MLANRLKALLIAGNPQRTVSHELLQRGTPAVLDFLFHSIPSDSPILRLAVPATASGAPVVAAPASAAPALPSPSSTVHVKMQPETKATREEEEEDNPQASELLRRKRLAQTAHSARPDCQAGIPAPAAKVALDHDSIEQLRQRVADLAAQVEQQTFSLSAAKRQALKKQLATERAHLAREETRLGVSRK
ncbi:MAG TPA: hypothetical protein V6C97_27905 [Oculatellaceae cyanobacterium]